MRLSSSTVFMQTLSGLSIELMAVLYFLFGAWSKTTRSACGMPMCAHVRPREEQAPPWHLVVRRSLHTQAMTNSQLIV